MALFVTAKPETITMLSKGALVIKDGPAWKGR